MKDKAPEISVTLLSCVLTIRAHNAHTPGALRYSAFMRDGMDRILSTHFSTTQPFVRDQVLVMGDSEIPMHDGAALLVEDFLKTSEAYVEKPRQLNAFKGSELRAIA